MTGAAGVSLCVLLLAQAAQPELPAFERPVEVGGGGRVAARLDRDVYEGARPDLGDVRVLDGGGRAVPFLIDRGETPELSADRPAEVRNQGWREDGAATAVLDFGSRLRKTRLRLDLSGDNFRRRVALEASEDAVHWATIVDAAWVFAVPGADAARYETVALPENDFPLLRVTVWPGEGERGRVLVRGAVVPAAVEPPRSEERLQPRWTQAEAAGESWISVELGARHQPFHALDLDVADGRFFREARVEARRDAPAPAHGAAKAQGLSWAELGRGALYRLGHGGARRECLRLDVSGRERVLRVRLRNADDRPLELRGVSVWVPVERVVFEAVPGRSYRLVYGSPSAPAPSFDLARTVGDPGRWAAGAADVPLGAVRRTVAAAAEPPWSERHPALLWGGLLAVVAALGLLTLRALRQVER